MERSAPSEKEGGLTCPPRSVDVYVTAQRNPRPGPPSCRTGKWELLAQATGNWSFSLSTPRFLLGLLERSR